MHNTGKEIVWFFGFFFFFVVIFVTFPTEKKFVYWKRRQSLNVLCSQTACLTSKFEGSRPEWCISSMIYSTDTPFWSETLEIVQVTTRLSLCFFFFFFFFFFLKKKKKKKDLQPARFVYGNRLCLSFFFLVVVRIRRKSLSVKFFDGSRLSLSLFSFVFLFSFFRVPSFVSGIHHFW